MVNDIVEKSTTKAREKDDILAKMLVLILQRYTTPLILRVSRTSRPI